ncbi:MAG: Plug and carboxypeptidase regulatory-like domain-containing protein [Acidobacteriota bacterium]|nr:Plug and carboxypeptidase regulatory-like domain-containing protein [Acidobacteriota bacterium]
MSTNLRRSIILSSLIASCALAQDRGNISGTVTDASGAAIPAVTVVLKNPATNMTQTTTSANDGGYTFIYLPAGKYSLTVEKQGFRKADVAEVIVNVNTSSHVDVALEVGAITESVSVEAQTPLLQTDRSDLGKVITNKQIQDLPLFLNGGLRSNIAFSLLTPGANASITGDPDTTGGAPRIAGGQAFGNSMLLDGGEAMSERRNDPAMRVVSAEGIEEFKVQSGGYSAEFGRTSNGVLNYTTKSGTNDFHGTAFLGLRNEDLNAQGFFYSNPSYTIHRQNLEAATIGGPVWIPKVFNGRNKAFFFFSGERSRAKDIANAGLISLPIPEIRNGDFRRYTNSSGAVIPLYDPFDASGNLIADANQRQRLQCNGVLNVICANRINPIAQTILKYVPQADNPSLVFNNTLGVSNGTRTPGENQAVYAIKGDYVATEKLRFNGLFSRQYFNSYELLGPVPGRLGEGFQEFGTTKWVRFNADYVARQNLLNHFTFGYNQRDLGEQGNQRIDDAYRQATLATGASVDKAPNYTVYQTEFGNYSSNVSTRSPGRTYNLSDQVAWLKGSHSFKIGMEYAKVSYARLDCNNCVGTIGFSASTTGNPSVSGTTGANYAGFLLGLGSGASFNYSANINMIFDYYAWYMQDDWKVNRKLTLNLGLRYDLPFARYEGNDQLSNFDPNTPNTGAGGRLGALVFGGDGPGRTGSRRLQQTRLNALGPRVGFAYQLNAKTVIRGGGAIMYDSNREDGNADNGIQGFGGSFNAPGNFYTTGVTYLFGKGFGQYGSLVDASRPPKVDPTLANNQSPQYRAGEAGRVGYFTDYNLTVEHSFSQATLLRASFHANYGIKFLATQNFNQLDPKYIGIYGNLLNSPVNSAAVLATGFQLPYANFPVNQQLQQALRPYPQYNGNINSNVNAGHSTYNALETSFEHRFNKGLYASVAYTFSKLITNVTAQNVYSYVQEKAISGNDRPHIVAIAYIYELPFGRGKHFGNQINPVVNGVLGNWKLSGVQRYQSGTPIGVSSSQNLFGASSGTTRPSFTPGQPLINPNWNSKDPNSPYINPAAFFQPLNGVYGNTPQNIAQLRQPNQLNEDVAASKVWNLGGERRTLEFRGSAFNVANRHLLGSLSTNVTSATFGRFTNPQTNVPRNIEFSLRLLF